MIATLRGEIIQIEDTALVVEVGGAGARVTASYGNRRQVQEVLSQSSFYSANDRRLHFGLGAATTVDKIIVHWPSGREQTLEKQSADRVLTIEEPKSGAAK